MIRVLYHDEATVSILKDGVGKTVDTKGDMYILLPYKDKRKHVKLFKQDPMALAQAIVDKGYEKEIDNATIIINRTEDEVVCAWRGYNADNKIVGVSIDECAKLFELFLETILEKSLRDGLDIEEVFVDD